MSFQEWCFWIGLACLFVAGVLKLNEILENDPENDHLEYMGYHDHAPLKTDSDLG